MIKVPSVGYPCIGEEGKLESHFCKHRPMCLAMCPAFVYYVMPNEENMSKLMLHCGKHDHPTRSGVATCEMKEEDIEAQCLFWESINDVMVKNKCEKYNLFGFM